MYWLIGFRKFLRCICCKKSLISAYCVPSVVVTETKNYISPLAWLCLFGVILLHLYHLSASLTLWKVILLLMELKSFYYCFLCPYQVALQSNFLSCLFVVCHIKEFMFFSISFIWVQSQFFEIYPFYFESLTTETQCDFLILFCFYVISETFLET